MAQYQYRAFNRTGRTIRGRIEAADEMAATLQLRERGLYPIRVEPLEETSLLQREVDFRSLTIGRVGLKDFVPFCRQFAALVRAGVTVVQSLEILTAQTNNKALKKALEQVTADVREGNSLQDAFGRHPKAFPEMFVNLVGVGEFSGQLETVLDRLADFYEKERTTKQKIVSALTYPMAVLTIAVAVSIFLLIKVVPTFVDTFEEQGVPLPLPTQMTVAVSNFLVHRWYLALFLAFLLAILVVYGKRTPQGKRLWGRLVISVPVLGKLFQKNLLARFARTFALLVTSAVPILDAVELTRKTLNNALYQRALDETTVHLREGGRIHTPLEQHRKLFPPMVTQMVAIGEESGSLDVMLNKLADFYEADVAEMTSRLQSLLEPIMILILAVMVGGIILSVYLPMFTMMDFIGQ